MIQLGIRQLFWPLQGGNPLSHASASAAAIWVVPESLSNFCRLSFRNATTCKCHLNMGQGESSSSLAAGRGHTLSDSLPHSEHTQHQQMPATTGNSTSGWPYSKAVWSSLHQRISKGFSTPAAFHSQAALDSGSDDDSKHGQAYSSCNGVGSSHIHAGLKQHLQQMPVHHNYQGSHLDHKPSESHKYSQQQHYPYRHAMATGQLHAAHGRRHVTNISNAPDPLSQQLLGAKGLGELRRIMLKYRANMGPEQVANTLLALQYLVLQTRQQRTAQRPAALHLAQEKHQSQQLLQPHGHGRHLRVQEAQHLAPRITRVTDRDGPTQQLTSQVLGELGNMIWHFLGDMSGQELAKLLYSWARLEWHPETQLLADVTASFHAAARADHYVQQRQQEGTPVPPVDCGSSELWMAAGLWGLCKVEQPLTVPSLQLLLQEWHRLLPLWSPQQLVDIAWAITAAADEQAIAEVQDHAAAAEEIVSIAHLQPAVLGLAEQLVHVLQQAAHTSSVSDFASPSAWPEVLVYAASGVATSGDRQRQQQHHVITGSKSSTPQLAWRMLQAVAGVGVEVHVVSSGRVGQLVDALSREMRPQGMVW